MSVNEATEVHETGLPDTARPGGVKVPPFPVYAAPGLPETVSDFPAVHREVTFARAIGFRPLKMDIWRSHRAAAPVPLVVWVHGGAFQLGDRRELPRTFAPDSVFRLLNEAGIACATVDYPHSLEAPSPAQLHDVKAAVRYLREFAGDLGVDPDRFGAWGESAGGQLAAMLGLTGNREDLHDGLGTQGHPSSISAVVDFYGTSSLAEIPPVRAAPDGHRRLRVRRRPRLLRALRREPGASRCSGILLPGPRCGARPSQPCGGQPGGAAGPGFPGTGTGLGEDCLMARSGPGRDSPRPLRTWQACCRLPLPVMN
jgi:acetyl esterase/lipase